MGELTQQFQELSQRVIGIEAALQAGGSADLAALLRTVQVCESGGWVQLHAAWCASQRRRAGLQIARQEQKVAGPARTRPAWLGCSPLLIPSSLSSLSRRTSGRSCGSRWRCTPSSRPTRSAASGAALGPQRCCTQLAVAELLRCCAGLLTRLAGHGWQPTAANDAARHAERAFPPSLPISGWGLSTLKRLPAPARPLALQLAARGGCGQRGARGGRPAAGPPVWHWLHARRTCGRAHTGGGRAGRVRKGLWGCTGGRTGRRLG